MPGEYASLLKKRAEEFAAVLKTSGIQATVLDATLREYSIKLELPQGKAVLYYKPNKATFQCQSENVSDTTLWARVLACWAGNPATTSSTSVTSPPRHDIGTDIFVDGSWVAGTTSFGLVVVQGDNAIWEGAGVLLPEEAGDSRQVAGELQAVRSAVLWCREHGIKQVTVHYDYAGIEKWASGEWRANQPLTQRYKADVESSGVDISWQKVEAHTGVKWNERADTLARNAAYDVPGNRSAPRVVSLRDVEECVSAFERLLNTKGIDIKVCLRQEAPIPHVQACVIVGDESWGYLNFYASAGRDPYPKFHELRTVEKQENIAQLWRQFKSPPVDELDEIDYYLKIFRPYGAMNVDFKLLADAVARVWDRHMDGPFNCEHVRYSFPQLEECVKTLRQSDKIATRA